MPQLPPSHLYELLSRHHHPVIKSTDNGLENISPSFSNPVRFSQYVPLQKTDGQRATFKLSSVGIPAIYMCSHLTIRVDIYSVFLYCIFFIQTGCPFPVQPIGERTRLGHLLSDVPVTSTVRNSGPNLFLVLHPTNTISIIAHPSPSKSKTRKLVVAAPERTFGPKSIRHNLVPSILYASK